MAWSGCARHTAATSAPVGTGSGVQQVEPIVAVL